MKSIMREFLVAGERVDVGFVFDSAVQIGSEPATGRDISGGYYGTKWGYVFGRGVITATGFRLRDRVLVLLTSSFEQTTSFDLGDAGSLLNGAALPDDLMPASAFTVSAGATPGRTAFTVDGIDAGVFLFTL